MIACPNLANKQVKQDFDKLKYLFGEDTAYYFWNRNEGHGIEEAPTGAKSTLFQDLLEITGGSYKDAALLKLSLYTQKFLKKFGLWTDVKRAKRIRALMRDDEPAAEFLLKRTQIEQDVQSFLNDLFIRERPYRPRSLKNEIHDMGDAIRRISDFYEDVLGVPLRLDEREFVGKTDEQIVELIKDITRHDVYNDLEKRLSDKLESLRSELKTAPALKNEKVLYDNIISSFLKKKGYLTPDIYDKDTLGMLQQVFPKLFNQYLSQAELNKALGYYKHQMYTKSGKNYREFVNYVRTNNIQRFAILQRIKKLEKVMTAVDKLPYVKDRIVNKMASEAGRYIACARYSMQNAPGQDSLTKALRAEMSNEGRIEPGTNQSMLSFLKPEEANSATTLLSNIKQFVHDESVRKYIDKLRAYLNKHGDINVYSVPVYGKDNIYGVHLDFTDNGDIKDKNGRIIVIPSNRDMLYEAVQDVIIHELAHAATLEYLNNNNTAKLIVQGYVDELLKLIEPNMQFIRRYYDISDIVGFQNTDEFVAEFISNSKFREILKNIPAISQSKFDNAFQNILGIVGKATGYVGNNALEQIMPVIDKVLNAQYEFGEQVVSYKGTLYEVEYDYDGNFLVSGDKQFEANKADNPIKYSLPYIEDDQTLRDIRYTENVNGRVNDRQLVYKLFGKLYLTKGESYDYNKTSMQEHIDFATRQIEKAGLDPNNFEFEALPKEGRIKVNVKWIQVSDAVDLSHDKSFATIHNLVNFLNEKFPGLVVHYITPKEAELLGALPNANGFMQNGHVYLIQGRIDADSAVEEMLHPFVTTLQQNNPMLFINLHNEATSTFKKLAENIRRTYTNEKGFTDSDRANELVTQALARMFVSKTRSSRIQALLNQFTDFIKSTISSISRIVTRAGRRIQEIDSTQLPKMSIKQLADLIHTSETEFTLLYENNAKQYSLTPDQLNNASITHDLKEQDYAERITKVFDRLYQSYKAQGEKSANKQKIQDNLFELLTHLKQQRGYEQVRIALEYGIRQLGVMDITTRECENKKTILGFMQESKKKDFSNLTYESLIDMWKNAIGFYQQLLRDIPDISDPNLTQQDVINIDTLNQSIFQITNLWKEALYKLGDRALDENINKYVTADEATKDGMRMTGRDWLHKNAHFRDLDMTALFINYGQSRSPIIRSAFHTIQEADTKALEELHKDASKLGKLYNKANTFARTLTPGNWTRMFMERDDSGRFTGNFIREYNYGQYEQDFSNFVEHLNEQFIEKYGYTYVSDANGDYINSATGDSAETEEWVNGEKPKFVEYKLAIEKWKSEHANRRFTYKYYEEMLSVPYDAEGLGKGSPTGHGLSPKAYVKYNRIQANINYYLNKCTDPETGISHPEELDQEDRLKLKSWQDRATEISSMYNNDGTLKELDDRKIAYEITAWNKWLTENTQADIDAVKFWDEYNKIKAECDKTNDYSKLNWFLRFNSTYGINQTFLDQTLGQYEIDRSAEPTAVLKARTIRAALRKIVRSPDGRYTRDLMKMVNSPSFWIDCRNTDETIEQGRTEAEKEFAEEFKDNFITEEILYQDAQGMYMDKDGNPTKFIQDAITFREYISNLWFNRARQSGFIEGLIDDQTGQPIDVSDFTDEELREAINEIFTYEHTYWYQGNLMHGMVPLNIFMMTYPKNNTFVNKKTGNVESTMTFSPKGRFVDKSNKSIELINEKYDKTNTNSLQLTEQYRNHDFDNIRGDDKALYDALIDVMKRANEMYYGKNHPFRYALPQIEGNTTQILSRIFTTGLKETLRYFYESTTGIQARDIDMSTGEDFAMNPDGTRVLNVPKRFVQRLDNPQWQSSDVVGSVIMFMNAALQYKHRNEVVDMLETMHQNLNPTNRDYAGSDVKYKYTAQNQYDTFTAMMNTHMYGQQYDTQTGQDRSRTKTFLAKFTRQFRHVESFQMLAMNITSAMAGLNDSISNQLREAIAGKYMSIGDWAKGFVQSLYYGTAAMFNTGDTVANNKVTALMQMMGFVEDPEQLFRNMYRSRGRKLVAQAGMKIFSAVDYFANTNLTIAFCKAQHLYTGDKIKQGYYTLPQMINACRDAGISAGEAKAMYAACMYTLWDAYDYSNGQVTINPKFEQYIDDKAKVGIRSKLFQRAGLYNGMNPDNDLTRAKQNKILSFIIMMRNWLIQHVEHLFIGGNDVNFDFDVEYDTVEVKGGKTKLKHKRKKRELTEEDRQKRQSYNWETGEAQDEIANGVVRAMLAGCRAINNILHGRQNTAKLSSVEKYAVKNTFVWMLMTAVMFCMTIGLRSWADDVPPSVGMQLNPKEFVAKKLYKLLILNLHMRAFTNVWDKVDIMNISDIVNNISTSFAGFNEQVKGISDLIEDPDDSIKVKSGSYKGETKFTRGLYRTSAVLDNLHTVTSYNGIVNNYNYYYNKFGRAYHLAGQDLGMKKSKVKTKKSTTDVPEPTFNEPNIPVPNTPF